MNWLLIGYDEIDRAERGVRNAPDNRPGKKKRKEREKQQLNKSDRGTLLDSEKKTAERSVFVCPISHIPGGLSSGILVCLKHCA